MFTEDVDGDYKPKVTKFVCKRCEVCFVGEEPVRHTDGKYCQACCAALRAENHIALSKLSVGNRLRLMFGQPFLPETNQQHANQRN